VPDITGNGSFLPENFSRLFDSGRHCFRCPMLEIVSVFVRKTDAFKGLGAQCAPQVNNITQYSFSLVFCLFSRNVIAPKADEFPEKRDVISDNTRTLIQTPDASQALINLKDKSKMKVVQTDLSNVADDIGQPVANPETTTQKPATISNVKIKIKRKDDSDQVYPKLTPDGNLVPRQRIIHVDLKGAPPKVAFFREFFKFVAQLGATGKCTPMPFIYLRS